MKAVIIWFRELSKCKGEDNEYNFKLMFGVIENIASQLERFLHFFLPDFIKTFMNHRVYFRICENFLEMIVILAQKVSVEQYLPIIMQLIEELLMAEIVKPQDSNYIHSIINFIVCMMIIFGDRFKGYAENFHRIIKRLPIMNIFYRIADEYMKFHFTLNNLVDAFTEN